MTNNLGTTRMEVGDILDQMVINRGAHRAEFEKAMEGYRIKAIELLEEHIQRIRNDSPEKVHVSLPLPEDHTPEYDKYIDMLERTLDKELLLDEYDFAQYIRDEWEWKKGWTASNALYVSAGQS